MRASRTVPAHRDVARPAPPRPALLLALLPVLTVVGLLRLPWSSWTDTVWAEDGTVFLREAAVLGPGEALLTSYAGYAHALPRLLAELVLLVPVGWAPVALSVSAAVVTAGFAVLVLAVAATVLDGPAARAAVSLPVVLLPVGAADVPLNLANLHWTGMYAAAWVLAVGAVRPDAVGPAPRGLRAAGAVAVLLVAASDPLTGLLVPLALAGGWHALRRRDPGAVAAPVALALGLTVQLVVRAGGQDRDLGASLDPVLAVTSYLTRVLPPAALGERVAGEPGAHPGFLLAVAAAALVLVLLVGVAVVRRHEREVVGLAAVLTTWSLAFSSACVLLTGVATPRYAVVPVLLLVAAGAVLLDGAPRTRWMVAATAVAASCLVISLVTTARVGNVREDGPSWSEEVGSARPGCRGSAELDLAPAGWTTELPCAELDR